MKCGGKAGDVDQRKVLLRPPLGQVEGCDCSDLASICLRTSSSHRGVAVHSSVMGTVFISSYIRHEDWRALLNSAVVKSDAAKVFLP
jgi:hypothetical protein